MRAKRDFIFVLEKPIKFFLLNLITLSDCAGGLLHLRKHAISYGTYLLLRSSDKSEFEIILHIAMKFTYMSNQEG